MDHVIPSIGDYGIIGDCQSAALISCDGALDWLCWPRFDSPAIFAGILDLERGGNWEISPTGDYQSTRRYLPNTNVLETRFQTAGAIVTLTDFMPLADQEYFRQHLAPDHSIVRLLRCETGNANIKIRFAPRPNFGMSAVKIIDRAKLGLRISTGHGMLSLHTAIRFEVTDGAAHAIISIKSGDDIPLVLTYSEASPEVMPLLGDAVNALTRTIKWWQNWSAANRYTGPYREAIARSVLTLKLLEFPMSGAFVAAPTMSLPERLEGTKNWDYRYCWLRDASLTIEALCGTGFLPEAEAFAEWLLHATQQTQPKLMVMYDVYGNLAKRERKLPHLTGFRGSSPVNLGNAARNQSQLDTYGEVISAAAKLLRHKGIAADRKTSKVLVGFGQFVCDHWAEADAGIWESRGEPTVHTHSRLLCWVALNALIDLHDRQLIRNVPVELFKRTRAEIRRCIEKDSWDDTISTYVSEPGTRKLDATLLRFAIDGFHDADSTRMRQTTSRVCQTLGAGGPLLYRNLPDDGKPAEGAFGICGFWRVHVIAMGGGSLAEAEAAFEELVKTGNDLGLFGEETDPESRAILGNFPQAFTHVGLITAAIAIENRRHGNGDAE